MTAIIVVPLVLGLIYLVRSKLGDATYDKIVGTFFLAAFAIVGLILLYGWLMGR